uniref:Uncharacterized protein n=2 Tax=Oryza TaxID=4527 RepID=A0A0D3H3P5_9ORYZ
MAVTGGAAGWRGIHVQELGRRSTISSRASLACRLPLVFIQKTKEEDGREHRRDQKAMDGAWWLALDDLDTTIAGNRLYY